MFRRRGTSRAPRHPVSTDLGFLECTVHDIMLNDKVLLKVFLEEKEERGEIVRHWDGGENQKNLPGLAINCWPAFEFINCVSLFSF